MHPDVIQPTGSRAYGSFEIAGTHLAAEPDAHIGNTRALQLSVSMAGASFFDPATGNAAARR